MLEYLFLVFIGPIEWLLRFILEWGIAQTQSYGLGIIIMSLVINFLLIPVYHLAETWQEAERSVQKRMADKLGRIKKAFSGNERYMVTRTLYRQNGYHPIFAMRASLGLLIQIPFFFAAYHVLSTYAPLQGANFAVLPDLAKPDGLLHIKGLAINVLPIIMTIISLASAQVYTTRLARRERIQLYAMSALFLILLYNAPSGMVFYWICNNIFSLLKNTLYEKLRVVGMATRADGYFFEPLAVFSKKIVASLHAASVASIEWKAQHATSWKLLIHPRNLFITLLAWISSFVLSASHSINKLQIQPTLLTQLFILSIGLVATQIFLFVPMTVYVSDPTVFYENPAAIAAKCTLYAFAFMAFFGSICWILRGAARTLFVFCVTYYSISSTLYLFVIARDYGTLDGFIFQFANKIYAPYQNISYLLLDIVIAASLISLFVFCIRSKRLVAVKYALSIFLIITVGTGFLSYNSLKPRVELAEIVQGEEIVYPPYVDTLFGFSREGRNIVVVMLDMFTGDHFQKMLEEYPEWHTEFDGFTWYPDVVSEGYSTILSEPSILGGPASTPYAINAAASDSSLEAIISKNAAKLPALLVKHDFHSSISGPTLFDEGELLRHMPEESALVLPVLHNDIGRSLINEEPVWASTFLSTVGIFQTIPSSLQYKIYRRGRWLAEPAPSTYSARNYAVLDKLVDMSNTDAVGNTFKYVANALPHYPWNISPETFLPMLGDPYPETRDDMTKVDGIIPEHYFTEVASLRSLLRWFKWMKKVGIYDNTQIILVSDHSVGDSVSLAKAFDANISGHTPTIYDPSLLENDPNAVSPPYPGFSHTLLLVKNANKRGVLQVNHQFMATSDTTSLIYQDIAPALGLEDSAEWARPWEQENRVRYHTIASNARARNGKNRYNIQVLYKITGTMFDKNNWEKVQLIPDLDN